VACGGENYITIAKVSNLAMPLKSQESGLWIIERLLKRPKPDGR